MMGCKSVSVARCARVLAVVALTVAVSAGCAKKISIEEGKAKIAELASRGVPEREMSDLKMYLFQMETAQKMGNSSQFGIYRDSLATALAAFEAKMANILANAGPFMDSLRTASDAKLAQLKGLHLEEAETGKGPVDSLMAIESQKLYARDRLIDWTLKLDTLVTLQKLADSLREEFVGIWVNELESPDKRIKRTERKEIHMKKDGTLYIMSGVKGKIDDNSSEDWLFETYGTWDLFGDEAQHNITREKRVRQIYTGMDPQTGKLLTEKKPPYDSTIAKGKRTEFVKWNDLNKEYKRFKK
jgi:hypothetical protein